MQFGCDRRWWYVLMALLAATGCGDSAVVLDPPIRGQGCLSNRPGRRNIGAAHPVQPPAPPPDVPAVAEPCTPESELLAAFDEYQTAFEDADGPRFLSLHTGEEQPRQMLACLRILRDRSRQEPALVDVLEEHGVTRELLDIAVAHNPEDPIESGVAAQTILPRLRDAPQLVSATLERLAADGPIKPQLFNLVLTGDEATATLVLAYPQASERSRLEFTRAGGRWLIAAEKAVPAAAVLPPAIPPAPPRGPTP